MDFVLFPESYNLLAFVSLVTGEKIDEAITSLKKLLSSSPGRHDFMYMLGQLYLHKGDYKAAREMLEQVAKSNADEEARQHSQSLLNQLSAVEQQRAQQKALDEEAKRAETSERGPQSPAVFNSDSMQTSPAAPDDPSQYLREVLRKPEAGEMQLQGKLVKIECEAKNVGFMATLQQASIAGQWAPIIACTASAHE